MIFVHRFAAFSEKKNAFFLVQYPQWVVRNGKLDGEIINRPEFSAISFFFWDLSAAIIP